MTLINYGDHFVHSCIVSVYPCHYIAVLLYCSLYL